jgi:hypothetical protein
MTKCITGNITVITPPLSYTHAYVYTYVEYICTLYTSIDSECHVKTMHMYLQCMYSTCELHL